MRQRVRQDIQGLVVNAKSPLYSPDEQERLLVPLGDVKMHLPMEIGAFTDFMCSLEHVRNVCKSHNPDP